MRTYNLNPSLAKEAGISKRISESGKYVGKFTRAEAVQSKKETEGVEFSFECVDGRSADFLSLWTFDNSGKEIQGLKMLNAIMTCLRVKKLEPVTGTVEKYSRESKSVEKFSAVVFNELLNKPIGLLLQREEYEKYDGKIDGKMNIYACFDASSGMMAGEILDKSTTATQLEKVLLSLQNKPLQSAKKKNTSTAADNSYFEPDSDFRF